MDQRGMEPVHQAMVCLGVDDSGDVSDYVCDLPAVLRRDRYDDAHSPDRRTGGISGGDIYALPDNGAGNIRRLDLAIWRVVQRGVQATTRRTDCLRRSFFRRTVSRTYAGSGIADRN